jgi:hypothetical protein
MDDLKGSVNSTTRKAQCWFLILKMVWRMACAIIFGLMALIFKEESRKMWQSMTTQCLIAKIFHIKAQ